jgi:hypothetical protein
LKNKPKESLIKISTLDGTNTLISELLSESNTMVTLIDSDIDEDDMTEVRQTMERLLTDSMVLLMLQKIVITYFFI